MQANNNMIMIRLYATMWQNCRRKVFGHFLKVSKVLDRFWNRINLCASSSLPTKSWSSSSFGWELLSSFDVAELGLSHARISSHLPTPSNRRWIETGLPAEACTETHLCRNGISLLRKCFRLGVQRSKPTHSFLPIYINTSPAHWKKNSLLTI